MSRNLNLNLLLPKGWVLICVAFAKVCNNNNHILFGGAFFPRLPKHLVFCGKKMSCCALKLLPTGEGVFLSQPHTIAFPIKLVPVHDWFSRNSGILILAEVHYSYLFVSSYGFPGCDRLYYIYSTDFQDVFVIQWCGNKKISITNIYTREMDCFYLTDNETLFKEIKHFVMKSLNDYVSSYYASCPFTILI